MKRILLALLLSLALGLALMGCGQIQGTADPDRQVLYLNEAPTNPQFNDVLDLPNDLIGHWEQDEQGNAPASIRTRTQIQFSADHDGSVWAHVIDPNANGLTAVERFSWSSEDDIVHLDFDQGEILNLGAIHRESFRILGASDEYIKIEALTESSWWLESGFLHRSQFWEYP